MTPTSPVHRLSELGVTACWLQIPPDTLPIPPGPPPPAETPDPDLPPEVNDPSLPGEHAPVRDPRPPTRLQ